MKNLLSRITQKLKNVFYRSSLFKQYLFILSATVAIVIISLILTGNYQNKVLIEEDYNNGERLFSLAGESLDDKVTNINRLANTLVSNYSVISFMKIDFYERTEYMDGVETAVANLKTINSNINSVLLFDSEDSLFYSSGDSVFDLPESDKNSVITFTGKIEDKFGNEVFAAQKRVFNIEQQRVLGFLGTCVFIFDFDEVEEIVNDYLVTKDSVVTIFDDEMKIVSQTDGWDMGYDELIEFADQNNYQIKSYKQQESNWTLVYAASPSALLSNLTTLQKMNIISYIMICIIFAILSVILYFGILKPASVLSHFMQMHVTYPKKRLNLKHKNEIGILAENLNSMLDDIQELSEEIYESQQRINDMKLARKQTQMIALRSQINPHFLYNTFECIRGMALVQGENDIVDITEALYKFYKFNVKGDEYATIREVVGNTKEYAKIINYRFMNKYSVVFNVDERLNDYLIPKMILQPLVENAVFHGLEPGLESERVGVEIFTENEYLVIKVTDDGVGMSQKKIDDLKQLLSNYDEREIIVDSAHGIGVINIYRRVKLFFEDSGTMEFYSKKGEGTSFIIKCLFSSLKK